MNNHEGPGAMPDADGGATSVAALSHMARERLRLASEPCEDERAGGPALIRFLGEAGWMIEPFRRPFRTIDIEPAIVPKRVMLLPGFATHPVRMRYLARQLERGGHRVKRWGLGFNWGPTQENFDKLNQRLEDVYLRKGEKLILVGWSLGGLFARELAKHHPDKVAKVVTMGSPFSYSPRANNVWRIYQAIAGHRVDDLPIEAEVAEKPPVRTVALWSPRDGIVHSRAACGQAGERDRAVALRCTHMGFNYHPQAIMAVARELDAERYFPDEAREDSEAMTH
ncbi:alpha/beta hydrolase [Alteriqipengyuania flavescens]|uniref:esterase/lipase family protein n=1 Tax=Alteriqipengyuania flavescens TaxID=3053610 RepID=UPI0025B389E4|nr:alpha/beta hydrolase [Alteriqipengyuania flavescens]WJY17860.1 alpha/beta hydrolase [Alteriqipengyuania flavescens]WJY23801.1 alpha/beta hydrolase [Alteriqipengyuania flavescens]